MRRIKKNIKSINPPVWTVKTKTQRRHHQHFFRHLKSGVSFLEFYVRFATFFFSFSPLPVFVFFFVFGFYLFDTKDVFVRQLWLERRTIFLWALFFWIFFVTCVRASNVQPNKWIICQMWIILEIGNWWHHFIGDRQKLINRDIIENFGILVESKHFWRAI